MSLARAIAGACAAWVAVACVPSRALAQMNCSGGMVVTPESAGHCCWPAQSWSDEMGTCTGAPSCPAGLAPHGTHCIAIAEPGHAATPATARETTASTASPSPAPQSAPLHAASSAPSRDIDTGGPHRDETTGPRSGLLVGGVTTFGVAYLLSAGAGIYNLTFANAIAQEAGALGFVPIFGPFGDAVILAQHGSSAFFVTVFVVDGVLQAAGVAMFVGAYMFRTPSAAQARNRDDGPCRRWCLLPMAADAIGGATFVWRE